MRLCHVGACRFLSTGLLFVLATAGSYAHAATYYVDPTGSDINAGTLEEPWRTIQHAADTLAAGDTVLIQPGVYLESVSLTISGAPGQPITYRALPGAALESPDPQLSLSGLDVKAGVGNLVLDGFELRNGFHETIFVRSGADGISIRNCNLHGNRLGIWIDSASDVEVDGCQIHGNLAKGLRVSGTSRFVTVRNTVSTANDDGWECLGDADGFVVEETASEVTFIDCEASANGEDGFDIQGNGVTLLRSKSTDNNCAGIKIAQSGRIENAIVTGNNLGITTGNYYNAEIAIEILNSTIAGNAGQQLYLRGSLLSPPSPYDVLVRNVIAYGPGKAIEVMPVVRLTEDHNLFFRDDTTSGVVVRHTGTEIRRYTGQEVNAGVWRLESGQGAGTWAIDPDFADLASYRLRADSAGIDAGEPAGAPLEDREQAERPQGGGFDLGAYEEPIEVQNHRPWADPGPDRVKEAGRRVDFTAYGSADPDGDAITYSWDFGDGGPPADGDTTSHTYDTEGAYTVTLTVSDGQLSRSRTCIVTVLPAPTATPTPTLASTATSTTTGTAWPTDTPSLTPTWSATATATPPAPTATPFVDTQCGKAPRTGCRAAPSSTLIIKKNALNPLKDVVLWRWLRGEATNPADFGDPITGTTTYKLCLFDTSAEVPSLVMSAGVPAGGTCSGQPCWRQTRGGGLVYRDKTGSANGYMQVVLKPGVEQRARVVVKAGGPRLPFPPIPLRQQSTVIVQFVNDEGECWGKEYRVPAVRNDQILFKAVTR